MGENGRTRKACSRRKSGTYRSDASLLSKKAPRIKVTRFGLSENDKDSQDISLEYIPFDKQGGKGGSTYDEQHCRDLKAMGLEAELDDGAQETDGEYEEDDEDDFSSTDAPSESIAKNVTDDAVSRRAWGKKASAFYEEGLENNDEASDDDQTENELQEEEAVQVHRELTVAMKRSDFGLEETETLPRQAPYTASASCFGNQKVNFSTELEAILSGLGVVESLAFKETSDECGREPAKENDKARGPFTTLSSALIHKTVEKDHPELFALLEDMKAKASEVKGRLNAILQHSACREHLTAEGLSYLEMRSHLLLCYLQYLCYYVLLKLHGRSVADHPVLERLIELRVLMSQLRPLDMKLQPQIQRLLQLATQGSRSVALSAPSVLLRPRPELLVTGDDEGREASDAHIAQKHRKTAGLTPLLEDDEDSGYSERAASDVENHTDSDGDGSPVANGLYKAPKLMAVEFTDKNNSMSRARDRAAKRKERQLHLSEAAEAFGEEFQHTPLEVSRNVLNQMAHDHATRDILKRQEEREAFEEDNMLRLPTTKADKKARRVLKEKQKLLLAGGSTLTELSSFADRAVDQNYEDPVLRPLLGLSGKTGGSAGVTAGVALLDKALAQTQRKRRKEESFSRIGADACHVTAKQVKRQRPVDPQTDACYFGQGGSRSDGESSGEEPPVPGVVREALECRLSRKAARAAERRKRDLETLPELDATVEGKRKVNYQIEKNKGLTRKRKKIEGNARVHNRQKFEKKIRAFKSVQQPMREPSSSGVYDGEKTGIKTHLKKSVTLGAA